MTVKNHSFDVTKASRTFSVVVPTYRRPAQLAACLAALAALDYPRECFEVVVVDDGSGAPPRDVIETFEGRLDVKLCEREHAGPSAARNTGAARAGGEVLAFTDDDCAPDSNWLRALAARFEAHPTHAIGGRTVNALRDNLCSETSQLIIDTVYAHFNPDPDDALFFASNNLAVPAKLFREAGGFDESFTTSEDREFCDRWLARGMRLSFAPAAVVRHAHALGLGSLWRQHFGYGRGATRFHRAREARGAGRFRPDPDFYSKLLRSPFAAHRSPRAAALAALLVWSQAANTAGFVCERFSPARARPKSGGAVEGET